MSKSSKKRRSKSSTAQRPNDNVQADSSLAAEEKHSFKPKTPQEKKKAYKEGIIKTAVASFIGIVAGIISYLQFGAGSDPAMRWYALIIVVAVLSFYAMRLVFPALKIRTKEFGFKDWFYVEFIVIVFWLVAWALLLN